MQSQKFFTYIIFIVLVSHLLIGCSDDSPLSPGSAEPTNGRWTLQSPLPTDETLNAVFFADENNGWAVGYFGTIIHTDDGGLSWSLQKSPIVADLYDVTFSDPRNGWAV